MIRLDYLPNHKEIPLYQDTEMFCINTDTGLLGEYIEVYKEDTVLDIGTNNGALLLYASRFNPRKLIGIDINTKALDIAKQNMEINGISNYELICCNASEYKSEQVDVIITNPPYFKRVDNKDSNIDIYNAKHEDSLPLVDLVNCISVNLKDKGKLFMIYQTSRLDELMIELVNHNIFIKELKFIFNEHKENSNTVLICAVKNGNKNLEVKKSIILK